MFGQIAIFNKNDAKFGKWQFGRTQVIRSIHTQTETQTESETFKTHR